MKPYISTNSPKANCLFLPGIPGKIKDFKIFDDLASEKIDIYFHQYPGTYGNEGIFNIDTIRESILKSISELDQTGKPLIIIAYSFSTYFILNLDLSAFKNIISVSFFSPILGIDTESINEDFLSTLSFLCDNGELNYDKNDWQTVIENSEPIDFNRRLKYLSEQNIPITFGYSLNDVIINVEKIDEELESFRQNFGYGKFLIFRQKDGYHKLDSYYNKYIFHYFASLMIMLDLFEIVGSDAAVYYWGSSQAYNLFRDDSDIDLLVFADNYLEKYKSLNEYVINYQKNHKSKFDLSINEKRELLSKKIFRFNRGPVIIHGVKSLYFALKKVEKTIDPTWEDIKQDAYRVNLINLLEARKILCKTPVHSERVKKIVKFYVMALIYLLYTRGNRNVDINELPRYFSKDHQYLEILEKALDLFRNNFNDVSIEYLYECVLQLTNIVSEQEKLLDINIENYEHSI